MRAGHEFEGRFAGNRVDRNPQADALMDMRAIALTAAEASTAEFWHTETRWEVVDAALQLECGAGYMNEPIVARLWRDARSQRIYGKGSEIMLEAAGRSL